MRTRLLIVFAVAAIVAAASTAALLRGGSGGSSPGGGALTAANALVNPHALGKVPPERLRAILHATNQITTSTSQAALIAEGRRLFRSTTLTRPGESCQGCHTEGGANPGLGRTTRDPPSLFGVGDTAPYGWVGNTPTLNEMVIRTVLGHFAKGSVQPSPDTAKQAAAIVAYLKTLDPPVSSFDQGTMSAAAIRGEILFQGKGGCSSCHFGPLFTDNQLHNTNVPNLPGKTDPGSAVIPGAFNTPTLRDVKDTGPYMHNGVFETLRQVVVFYNTTASTAPLGLTDVEIDELVAYLEAL
jgi:cytochrome c peroxidase